MNNCSNINMSNCSNINMNNCSNINMNNCSYIDNYSNMNMDNCSNVHFFYDKYAGDHTFSNNITSKTTIHKLINTSNFIIYNNDDANVFFKNKFNDNKLCELDNELLCSHVYITKIENNNMIDKNYIIPSIYTMIGINPSKLKKYIDESLNIPNVDILKNLFYFHYNYEKKSKYMISDSKSFELNISSVSKLFKIIYFFVNHNEKKLNDLGKILYFNNNDHIIQIGDVYYDVNKQKFLSENNNDVNFDLLFFNLPCCRLNVLKKNKYFLNKIIDIVILLLKLQQKVVFICPNDLFEGYLHFFNVNLNCKLCVIKTYSQLYNHVLKNTEFEHIIILSENIIDILYEKNFAKKTKNNVKNKCIELLKKYIMLMCDDIYNKYDIIFDVFKNKKIIIYSNENKYLENKQNNEIICVYNFMNYSYSICYQKNKIENEFIENEYFPIKEYMNVNIFSIIKCNIFYTKRIYYFCVKLTPIEELIYWLFINEKKYNMFFSIPFYYYIRKFLISNDISINLNIKNKKIKVLVHNKSTFDINISCSKHDYDMLFSIFNNRKLNCCICLNFIQNSIGISKCHHYFCYDCIILYLQNNECCPYCRTNLKNKNENEKICSNYSHDIYRYNPNEINNIDNKTLKITYIGTKLLQIIKFVHSTYDTNIKFILLSSWNLVIEKLNNMFNKVTTVDCEIYSKHGHKKEQKNVVFTTLSLLDIDFNYIFRDYKKIYVIFLDQYIYINNKYFINKSVLFNKKIHFVNFFVQKTFDEDLINEY